jgi:two-component system, sensor histidine kinase ChiS
MRQYKSTTMKLAVLILATFAVIAGIINSASKVSNANKPMPVAVNGTIDLSEWDFEEDGMLKLDGDWEFYESQLLSPDDFASKELMDKKLLSVPGNYGDEGYGTYRLKMILKDHKQVYSIKIDFLQSAYKLWAGGQEIISAGKPGQSKFEMKPLSLPRAGSFTGDDNEVYLTLQVSNFYSKLALIDTIVMGTDDQISSNEKKLLAFDLFLFGSTIMGALYNLALFLKRRKNLSALYFSIVCMIVAIRTLFLGQRFIISIFPDLNYILSGKIMHWTFFLYIPFIVLFIDSFYEKLLDRRIVKLSKISAYIYGFLILISDPMHYMNLILPFEAFTILVLAYMIYKVSRLYIERSSSDYIMVLGLVALLITIINDILYEYSIIITGTYAAFGTLIFIIANSYLLAERQSLAFTNAEALSEKLKSLNALKDEFLAVTSHELKTPLNGIIGLAENLKCYCTNNFNEEQIQNIELIYSSAKRLSNLVNDITVFSRLKNGEVKLQEKPVDLWKIADQVVKFCSLNINNKEVSIINLIDSSAPLVFGDEERIQQIFFNIISNAIKFTTQGTIKLCYSIKVGYIEISVEDTGIGIPKERLDSIFEMYEQIEGISERFGGTGLGLYITKKLVQLHGGTIGVSSTPGKGSSFRVTLPLSKGKPEIEEGQLYFEEAVMGINPKIESEKVETIASQDNAIIEKSCEKEKYKLLVVDDDYVNQRVLQTYLARENFTILRASSGREALKIISDNKDLDLVILDVMMPDMLGYEVTAYVREKYTLFELPILIMTAISNVDNLILAFKSGSNDYLPKPLNKQELLARVNTLITLKNSVNKAIKLTKQIVEADKQVEELKENDRLKTELFTNMSHELRTPLNVICSSIQLLSSLDDKKQLGDERIRYYLSIMRQNSVRLLRLINNIIDMSKLEGNHLILCAANKDIVYVVEELCQSVAEYIKSKDIEIIFDTDMEEKLIAFDEEKLERIILNVLSNAVKFTDKGGSIFVNVRDKDDYVEISIKDTGIGIPEDKLNFIFERFAQLDRSLSRRSEGSGIGLSLVKSLVELHGGKIFANSELGVGTEFIIQLPARVLDEQEAGFDLLQDKESRYEKNIHVEFSDIYL